MGKLGKKSSKREPKTKIVGTRLTEEEYALVKERCERLGMSASEYLRYVLTHDRAPKVDVRRMLKLCEGYREIAREINAIGVNLNQLVKRVNIDREIDVRVLEKIVKIEGELRTLLKAVYDAIERELSLKED